MHAMNLRVITGGKVEAGKELPINLKNRWEMKWGEK